MSPTPLARLKGLAALALQHADGERAVLAALQQAPLSGPVRVLALGKAAAAMWRGAARALANQLCAVLVIAPAPPNEADAFWQAQQAVPVQWQIGSHPLPDQRSLAAGAMARRFVAATTPDETLLVLLSGGASALCEDLPAGVSLAELQALQQALLAADWPIAHINALRQRLSTIKAGGLARCCPAGVVVRQLIISDVPGDDPAVVGSAPFLAGQLPLPEPLDLPAAWQAWWLQHQSHRAAVDRADVNVHSEIIASNHSVRAALQMFAQNQDWPVQANQAYHGNCAVVAEQLAEELQRGAEGLYLFGGECHLMLPASPGRGGRNQHLALQLAQHLPRNLPVTAMMLASDGVDGQSDAAGAVFAPTALTAAQVAAIPAALRSASSYDYWRQHGGLVLTGATGSNVADLVLCWKSAAN